MKKALISAYSCCPERGSEPGNGWSWVTGYVNEGYEVICVTSNRYLKQLTPYANGDAMSGLKFSFVGGRGMDLLLRVPLFGDYLHYFTWLFSARRRLKTLASAQDPDLTQHVTYCQIRYGTPVYGMPGKSIIGPLGGNASIDPSLKRYIMGGRFRMAFMGFVSRMILRLNPMVGWSLRDAEVVLYSNSIIRELLEKYPCKRMMHMPDAGLSDDYRNEFVRKPFAGPIDLLWVGRNLPSKGLNLAIEAMRHLGNAGDYRLVVVGDGPCQEQCDAIAKTLPDPSSVVFMGKMPYASVQDHYERAHVFLFPSLKDSCPMQVYEAMAYGLPVVTLDHQGLRDQVVEGTGLKVRVAEGVDYPVELAKAVRSMTRDAETYHSYSKAAHVHGQKQIWSGRIGEFLSLMEKGANV